MTTDDPPPGALPQTLPRDLDPARHPSWSTLTVRQRFIADRLDDQSPVLADWYVSAVATMATRSTPAWAPIVGHLCRDLMNGAFRHFDLPTGSRVDYGDLTRAVADALPDPLNTISSPLPEAAANALRELVNAHRELTDRLSPEALFTAAGRPATGSEVARRNLVRAWRDTQQYFVGITHIGNRGAPPIDLAELERHFALLEDMLAAQLRSLPYWSLDGELREIAALPAPTADELQRAMLLWRGDAETTFIESLTSPAWVPLLVDAGFLDAPQQIETVGDGVRLPFWPVSRYLARVAGRAPASVMAAIERLGPTENGRVHADLVEAALAMPPQEAVKAIDAVIGWLGQPWSGFAAEAATRLALALAGANETAGALRLAGKLVSFDVRVQPRDAGGDLFGPRVHYATVFHSDGDYSDALSDFVPGLVAADPAGTVNVLARILGGILARERRLRNESGPEDDSWIWRKAIADHVQDRVRDDPRDRLVTGLRDAAESTIADDPANACDVFEILDAQPHLLFRRLTMHLARRSDAPELTELRRTFLMDRERFDATAYRNEYFSLAHDRFGELSPADQETILGWIDDGPDLAAWRGHAPEPQSQDEAAERADWWRYERLIPISDHLNGDAAARLAAYRERFGAIEDPNTVRVGWGQPDSQYDVADLRALDAEQLLDTIINYEPRTDVFPPESEGALAHVVQTAAAEEPHYWLPLLLGVADRLPEDYEAAALNGAWDAGRTGTLTHWEPTLALAEHALARTDNDQHDHGRLVDAVVRVVEVAAHDSANQPAAGLTPRLIALVRALVSNSNPTPATDAARRDEPAHGAITAPRSRALDAAIVLALRLHPDARAIATPALRHLPAIQALLEEHLDPTHEPSPLVRYVYGARLGELFFLDEPWTLTHLDQIFDADRDDLADAAWRGYLLRSYRAPRVFEHVIAAGLYADHLHVLRGPSPRGDDHGEAREAREGLIEHLVYAWAFAVPGYGTLVDELFSIATPNDRVAFAQLLAFRVLQPDDADGLVAGVAPRLLAFWRARLDTLSPGDPELAAYGWWYSSGALAEPEATELFVRTLLAADGAVTDLRGCLDRAAVVAAGNPLGACDVLSAILDSSNRDELPRTDDRTRRLLQAVADTRDSDALARVASLIDRLGEYGIGDYRDVSPNV